MFLNFLRKKRLWLRLINNQGFTVDPKFVQFHQKGFCLQYQTDQVFYNDVFTMFFYNVFFSMFLQSFYNVLTMFLQCFYNIKLIKFFEMFFVFFQVAASLVVAFSFMGGEWMLYLGKIFKT
jgi:hypothetical protein